MKLLYVAAFLALATFSATGSRTRKQSKLSPVLASVELAQPGLEKNQSSEDPGTTVEPVPVLQLSRELQKDLPAVVAHRLSSELDVLGPDSVRELHDLFYKEGKCMSSTATLFMEHYAKSAKKEGIVECAKGFLNGLRSYLESQDETAAGKPSYPGNEEDAAAWEEIRRFHNKARHSLVGGLERAVLHFLLLDKGEETRTIRAFLLIGTADRAVGRLLRPPPELWSGPKGTEDKLLKYWEDQDPALLLNVYLGSWTDENWDLLVLHPIIFANMDCVRSRSCGEDDYLDAFRNYFNLLYSKKVTPASLKAYFLKPPFPMVAKILRNLVGEALRPQEALEALKLQFASLWDQLQQPGPAEELQGKLDELAREMVSPGPYHSPSHPHLFLGEWKNDMKDVELEELKRTVEELVFQVFQLELKLIKASERPLFPYGRVEMRMTKPITGKETFGEYREKYNETVGHLLDVLQMPLSVQEGLGSKATAATVAVFWQILDFLLRGEENKRYGGHFGLLIAARDGKDKELRRRFDELAQDGFEGLVQELLDGSDEECRERLSEFTVRLIELHVPGHPICTGEFSQFCRRLEFTLADRFQEENSVGRDLNTKILAGSVDSKGLEVPFGKLQRAVVARRIYEFWDVFNVPRLEEEKLSELLAEYTEQQLRIIYGLDHRVYFVFKHRQLLEGFELTGPLKKWADVLEGLTKAHQATHHSESIFGSILEEAASGIWALSSPAIKCFLRKAFEQLPLNRDFRGNSDGCWLMLKRIFREKLAGEPGLGSLDLTVSGKSYTLYELLKELDTEIQEEALRASATADGARDGM